MTILENCDFEDNKINSEMEIKKLEVWNGPCQPQYLPLNYIRSHNRICVMGWLC